MKRFQKIADIVFRPGTIKQFINNKYEGYFHDIGWFLAFEKKEPIDANGEPIPWVTYPFIDFITERLSRDFNVFEYGSGNSTLFYSQRVKNIVAVENNHDWYSKMKKRLPSNGRIIFKELSDDGEYSSCINTEKNAFEVIIVDGRNRVSCIENSIKKLSSNGVIVLDDSERVEYTTGINLLKESGFSRLDFWGFSPGLLYKKCTTVFYKQGCNCLDI